MAGALVAGAGGTATLAFVTAPWHALALNAFLGLTGGVFLPGRSALLASLAGAGERHAAYGLQFAAANLGIAAGAGVGGLVAHSSSLGAYQALFLIDAAVTASFALLVLLVTRTRGRAPAGPEAEADAELPGRYRDLLQHRALVGFIGITALIGLGGLAVFEVGLPVFARNEEGLDERGIGLLFFANSIVIVLAQFPVMKLIEGRRRLHAVALALGLWACAWLLVAFGSPVAHGSGDVALFVAVVALFAVGECLIAPIQGALVVDLAPERLRGRCLAAHSSAYAVGMTLGPPLVGVVLTRQPELLWFAGAGVLAFAGLMALALDRRVPAAARRTPSAERFGSAVPALVVDEAVV